MRLLVTRPPPDGDKQAETLRAMGHTVLVEPLLTIEFLPPEPLPLEGVQAVLVTSRNALRAVAGGPELEHLRALPLLAVGEATAALAWDLRFARVEAAAGTGESLAELVETRLKAGKGPLLQLAGVHQAFDLKTVLEQRGYEVRQAVLYRAKGVECLSEKARHQVCDGRLDGVILMSPRSATRFAELVETYGLGDEARGLRYFCLSAAVADALRPLGCRNISVPVTPSSAELLALIGDPTAEC